MATKNILNVHNDWISLLKTADTEYTSTSTLASDPVLQFAVVANGAYRIRGSISFFAFANGDYKFALTGPALTANRGIIYKYSSSTTVVTTAHIEGYIPSTTIATAGSIHGTVLFEGLLLIAGAGGTVAYQAAQGTSHADTSYTLKGSLLEYRRIA